MPKSPCEQLSYGEVGVRKWLLVSFAVAISIIPVSSRATVPIATARGTVEMLAGICHHCPATNTYTLVGSFRVGTKTYTGTVTGSWTFADPQTGGFSGSNGSHTFSAGNCTRQAIAGVDTMAFSNSKGQYPSGDNEVFICSASIDGAASAPIVLDFAYVWFYPVDQVCCLYGFSGYFVGA